MTNPFDVDDLLKRSIFSSILEFGRKVKNTGRVGSVKDEDVSGSATSINNNSTTALSDLTPYNRKYRTKQEIYNEIVCECAELEKNKVPSVSNSAGMRSVGCSTNELTGTTTNPRSPDPHLSTEHSNNRAMQDLVQLLVTAVKESGILNDQNGTNSPEDILKRKRLQNKKAAIRYRKRQKELREEAEMELTILVNKNNELKNEIKRMQAEIDQLKARVLNRTSEEAHSSRKI
uniref:BZIP domain-containing protein n=1 Tax=Elaeophora elaphi TaxID=1147741 RepID=A0A0R3S2S4_9BILA